MRIVAVGTTSREVVRALGLGAAMVDAPSFWADAWGASSACALAPYVEGHPNPSATRDWADAVSRLAPHAVVADVACTTCLNDGVHKSWAGPPRLIAIGRPALADCLNLLTVVGAILGAQEQAAIEVKQRAARLLALRMHVARYLIRTPGAIRPVTLALDFDAGLWRVRDDRRSDELIDAAGGVAASLPARSIVQDVDIARASVDVVLAGSEVATTTSPEVTRAVDSIVHWAPSVWHADWSALVRSSGPSIVDAVESTLRAVFPVCLGANGTPPDPASYRRAAVRGPDVN